MQYNTIAHSLCFDDKFGYSGDAILLENLMPVILKVISSYHMDILTLQEIDDTYSDQWQDALVDCGFDSIFHFEHYSHGVMIAFKAKRFKRVEKELLSLSGLYYHDRSLSAGIIARLEIFDKNLAAPLVDSLVVATGHFYYHPLGEYERMNQITRMLEAMDRLSTPKSEFVLAGDFNSPPDNLLYRYLEAGKMTPEIIRETKVSGKQYSLKQIFPGGREIPCNIIKNPHFEKLQRRATKVEHLAEDLLNALCDVFEENPKYTNKTDTFSGCLNYIYVSDGMVARGMLEMPTVDFVGLPMYDRETKQGFPSDHLCIAVDIDFGFRIKPRKLTNIQHSTCSEMESESDSCYFTGSSLSSVNL